MAGTSSGRAGLTIATDPAFDRRQWKVERVGWLAMVLVLVLALLGIFGGGGPLMNATERSGDFEVRYNRMIRVFGPTTIEAKIPVNGNEARLTVDPAFVRHMAVERVSPEPDSTESGPDGVTYVFPVQSGTSEVEVTFSIKAQDMGVHSSTFTTDAGSLSFWQFAFP